MCDLGQSVHGIYHANRGGHILNNLAYHNRAYGIHLWHAASDVVISGNTVFNNGSSGLGRRCRGQASGKHGRQLPRLQQHLRIQQPYGFVESGNTGTHNRYTKNLTYENKLGPFQLQNGNVASDTINAVSAIRELCG